jgi:hypothetical protein
VNGGLERLEAIIDTSGVAGRIEVLLPIGVRPRQLPVRTLLLGMLLIAVHGRPAHLVRVHQALLALPADQQHRLGIITEWRTGPHLLSYRQVERTLALIINALSKDKPDGTPSDALSDVLDRLLEASVTVLGEPATSSYAVDWTDHETWSRPPPKQDVKRDDPKPPTPSNQRQTTTTTRTRRTSAAPIPRRPGGTAAATTPAKETKRSTATTSKPPRPSKTSTAHRSPSSPDGCC